jgi:hypothetical protein
MSEVGAVCEVGEDVLHFRLGQHRWHAVWTFGALDVTEGRNGCWKTWR